MAEEPNKPHAVLVPGPGLGHVNGCVLLAKALISAGFRVTLACFERAYQTHARKGRLSVSHPAVHLEIVPDGLPPDAASYVDLFQVTPSMHHHLLLLLRSLSAQHRPATCLIADTIMAWTQHVADLVGIPRVEYWTSNATSYLPVLALADLHSKGYVGCHQGIGPIPSSWKMKTPTFVECIPGFASFPLEEVPIDFRYASSIKDPLLERFIEANHLAKPGHCVLIHSVYDLEREAFEALKNATHIDAIPIGPLVHQYDTTSSNSANSLTLSWLDAHAPSSVIFVSFGSNFVHTRDEIVEIAHGLEASGKAFLWVIRLDSIVDGCEIDVVLPCGFKERTTKRGLITSWVSQLDVLAHVAVGGFLSHCGWNSTIESIWHGVPILACPKRAEQPINCRFISKDWGVGIELETTIEGSFSRHQVQLGICALLDEVVGNQARAKARELSSMLKKVASQGGQSHSNLLKFASKMKARCLQHV